MVLGGKTVPESLGMEQQWTARCRFASWDCPMRSRWWSAATTRAPCSPMARWHAGETTTTIRSEPFPVAGLSGVSVLSAGQRHTCALVENGAVKCWGDNSMGQLGDGTLGGRVSPVEVNGVTESRFHPLNSEHGALVGGFCLAPALLS